MGFPERVKVELERAREIHPTHIHNGHEGYSVILEELDEFWDEVKKKNPCSEDLIEELIQVAAMCQRTAEDIGLIKRKN